MRYYIIAQPGVEESLVIESRRGPALTLASPLIQYNSTQAPMSDRLPRKHTTTTSPPPNPCLGVQLSSDHHHVSSSSLNTSSTLFQRVRENSSVAPAVCLGVCFQFVARSVFSVPTARLTRRSGSGAGPDLAGLLERTQINQVSTASSHSLFVDGNTSTFYWAFSQVQPPIGIHQEHRFVHMSQIHYVLNLNSAGPQLVMETHSLLAVPPHKDFRPRHRDQTVSISILSASTLNLSCTYEIVLRGPVVSRF